MAKSPSSLTSATLSNVATSTTNATLLSANASASRRFIFNDQGGGTGILLVKFGTTASATSFTIRIPANTAYEFPLPLYTGRVDGILDTGTGTARVTEY